MEKQKVISPLRSWTDGLVVSGVVGIVVFVIVRKILAYALDFWYLGDVLGPAAGVFLGCLSAFEMFTRRLREVPLNWVSVSLFLEKPTGAIYSNGTHWVPPFFDGRNTPGPNEKYPLEMPGERIDAQDGALVLFGEPEHEGSISPEHKGKRNRIQYSVIDPILYIMMDDPEDELREAYLEMARLFFGQASQAVGVKGEKLLFSEFISLPYEDVPGTEPEIEEEHAWFENRLRTVMFCAKEDSSSRKDPSCTQRLFEDGAVQNIMGKAGSFNERAARWGIGNIIAFTPNVRENPEAESAAAQKRVAIEQMVGLATKANELKKLSGQLTADNKVNPDLAATLLFGLEGQKVLVENKTINLSGIPEAVQVLGGKIIEAVAKKKEGSDDK